LTATGKTLVSSGIEDASGIWSYSGGTTTGNNSNACQTGKKGDVPEGTYLITQEVPGSCETGTCTIVATEGCTLTATPVITQAVILNNTANLTGTAVSGSFVRLFLNGNEVASQTASGVNYSFALNSYFLNVGDVLEVSAQSGTLCVSNLVSRTVSCFIAPPVITASENGLVASGAPISGVSSAAPGTIVSVFNNTTNALVGTATVTATFSWATSFNAVAGTSYYATQSTACGLSGLSAIVTGTTPTSNARCGSITGPVLENAVNVTGTLSSAVANTLVRLYIDGAFIGQATTSNTSWSIPATQTTPSGVLVPLIFAGGVLTVEVLQPNQIGVLCPATTTVQCIAPLNTYTFSITPSGTGGNGSSAGNRYIFSGSSFTVTVNGTEDGVLYTLEDETGVDQSQTLFGSSTGSIVFTNVTTPLLPGDYDWKIKATKPGACTEVFNSMFLQKAVYTVSGVVRNDTDALSDGEVNGTGTNAGGLNAVLVSGGNVVAVTAVDATTGTFTFNGVLDGTYTIQLNTIPPTVGQPAPVVSLPLGWVSTGEFLGTTAGNDGLPPNSILSVVVNGANVANAQLGIQQPPISGNGVNSGLNKSGTQQVAVPANTFTNGNGTILVPSTDVAPGTVSSIRITGFPTGASSIVINGVAYYPTAGDVPVTCTFTSCLVWPSIGVPVLTDGNGAPTVPVTVDPTDPGFTQIIIPFVAIDNAGFESANQGEAILNLVPSPDLTPTIDLPSNTFNPDQVKNAVLIVEEVNNIGTAPGVTTFGLSAPVGYEILAYDGNLLEMAPSGGNTAPVNNTEFEVILSNSAQIVFRAKAGVSIGARSFKAVGIQLKRTSALNGSVSNITINITTDPTLTYDSNDFNNIFSRILNAQ
jgi:hypothetical protein